MNLSGISGGNGGSSSSSKSSAIRKLDLSGKIRQEIEKELNRYGNSGGISSISWIQISNSLLQRIPFGIPDNILILDLSRNHIDQIHSSLAHCVNLQVLNLSHNELSRIEGLGCCSRLKELRLSHNHIGMIQGISKLRELEILDLRFNQITANREVLRRMSQLPPCFHTLQVKGNPIASKWPETHRFVMKMAPSLEHVDVEEFHLLREKRLLRQHSSIPLRDQITGEFSDDGGTLGGGGGTTNSHPSDFNGGGQVYDYGDVVDSQPQLFSQPFSDDDIHSLHHQHSGPLSPPIRVRSMKSDTHKDLGLRRYYNGTQSDYQTNQPVRFEDTLRTPQFQKSGSLRNPLRTRHNKMLSKSKSTAGVGWTRQGSRVPHYMNPTKNARFRKYEHSARNTRVQQLKKSQSTIYDLGNSGVQRSHSPGYEHSVRVMRQQTYVPREPTMTSSSFQEDGGLVAPTKRLSSSKSASLLHGDKLFQRLKSQSIYKDDTMIEQIRRSRVGSSLMRPLATVTSSQGLMVSSETDNQNSHPQNTQIRRHSDHTQHAVAEASREESSVVLPDGSVSGRRDSGNSSSSKLSSQQTGMGALSVHPAVENILRNLTGKIKFINDWRAKHIDILTNIQKDVLTLKKDMKKLKTTDIPPETSILPATTQVLEIKEPLVEVPVISERSPSNMSSMYEERSPSFHHRSSPTRSSRSPSQVKNSRLKTSSTPSRIAGISKPIPEKSAAKENGKEEGSEQEDSEVKVMDKYREMREGIQDEFEAISISVKYLLTICQSTSKTNMEKQTKIMDFGVVSEEKKILEPMENQQQTENQLSKALDSSDSAHRRMLLLMQRKIKAVNVLKGMIQRVIDASKSEADLSITGKYLQKQVDVLYDNLTHDLPSEE